MNRGLQFLLIHPADSHAGAIVEQDIHGLDVLHRLARHLSVSAARIISEHSAKGAVRVRGGIWAPSQLVRLGRVSQLIANRSRLNTRVLLRNVQFKNVVQVLGPVDNDRNVTALARNTRPAAP